MLRALPPAGSVAPARAMQIARRLPRAMRTHKPHLAAVCEVAQTLSDQLGLAVSIQRLFRDLTERWDGKGLLRRAERNEIPLPVRITHVAIDAGLHRLLGGEAHAAEVMRGRAGKAFDPDVAACVIDDPGILAVDLDTSAWELTLAYEPQPVRTLDGDAIDRALLAMAAFSDLLSPAFSGHSVGVADLSATAGARGGLDPVETRALRRAALVHDLGRVAVGAAVWNKPGRLTVDEWEQVRLHPYHTERILSRSPFLSSLVPSAGRPPRTARPIGVPPRGKRRGARSPGAPARRGRLVPRDDRAPPLPAPARSR